MPVITEWTNGHADALRRALRMTSESFADYLGISERTVANWRKWPEKRPQSRMHELLDVALERSSDRVKAQFALLVEEFHAPDYQSDKARPFTVAFDSMTSRKWDREDAHALSLSFDSALERSAVEDVERLAHMWLICEPPQAIELSAGRRVSDALVTAVEHRVIQLRRADDFITGPESRELMRNELKATVRLLTDASLTEEQARRVLTAIGELAQLAAWVAGDAELLDEAARFVRGGVIAARAAKNAPLAANLISTFSYQIANTGNPNEAVMLARTAYQGGQHEATPIVRALLLERVAWATARAGDLRACEQTLGLVEDCFSGGPKDGDPDWLYWLNREEVDVMAGRCYTELRRPDRAEPILASAIQRYNQTFIRENSLYLSWLAEDYVQLGEIEHAADIATHMAVLAARTNSARTDSRLHHITKLLGPYRGTTSVADFYDVYQSTPDVSRIGKQTKLSLSAMCSACSGSA
jgi:hypothetical protein